MTYSFPDVEAALLEVVPGAVLWQAADFASGVVAGVPLHHVYVVGGSEDGPFRADRVDVDTYGAGRDASRDAAESVRLLLTSGPHHVPGVGLLDLVAVDVPPRSVPYQDDRVYLTKTTYRVDTRAL